MGDMGVRTLIITGGEPLLREDIFEVFRAAHEAGVANTALATNGYLVSRFENELKEAGLSAVHISIDGLPETNDRIRGVRHASERAWSALSFFEDIGVGERVLNTIVHKKNIHELEELAEHVCDSSATVWNLQIALPVGRAKRHDYLKMEDDDISELFRFAVKARRRIRIQMAHHLGYLGRADRLLRTEPFFCGAGTQTCAILAGGEVVGCQVYYDPASAEGNIRRESFKDIWERLFTRFFNAEAQEECKSCRHFSACLGGCSAYREIEGRCCLKDIWENLETSGR
jgi:radical SAM protein with 4Fe4S-binding SPASM domain